MTLLRGRDELHGDRIHAVADVFIGEAFAFENVTEVATTARTGDLRAVSVGINRALNCAIDFVVEAGPSAAGVEFVGGAIEWCIALFTDVGSCGGIFV